MAKILELCFTLMLLALAFAQNPYNKGPGIPFEKLPNPNAGRPLREINFILPENQEGTSSMPSVRAFTDTSSGSENLHNEKTTLLLFDTTSTYREGPVVNPGPLTLATPQPRNSSKRARAERSNWGNRNIINPRVPEIKAARDADKQAELLGSSKAIKIPRRD